MAAGEALLSPLGEGPLLSDLGSKKQLHEAFISGHGGSSLGEVAFCAAVPALGAPLIAHFLRDVVFPRLPEGGGGVLRVLSEIFFTVVPLLAIATTDFASSEAFLVVFSVLLAGFLLRKLWLLNRRTAVREGSSSQSGASPPSRRNSLDDYDEIAHLAWLNARQRPFIGIYRGGLMLLTMLAILAVDFTIFPRRHAKTERSGISLMDMGVGAFILSAGLVSQQARPPNDNSSSTAGNGRGKGRSRSPGRRQRTPSGPSSSDTTQKNGIAGDTFAGRVKKALTAAVPLLVLGGVRFATVRASDYHEHVSEYGVHWNFFLTLAVVSLVVPLLNVPPAFSVVAGVGIAAAHELVLSPLGGGGAAYVDAAIIDRSSSFFSANREGIISSTGYVALFFLGAALGRELRRPRRSMADWKLFLSVMWQLQVVVWFTAHQLDATYAPYSRRMVNISYIAAVFALAVQALAATMTVCVLLPPVETRVLDAVNYNGLFLFLGANLMTGAVNLSMDTISTPAPVAFVILVLYLLIVTGAAVFLHRRRILMKFW